MPSVNFVGVLLFTPTTRSQAKKRRQYCELVGYLDWSAFDTRVPCGLFPWLKPEVSSRYAGPPMEHGRDLGNLKRTGVLVFVSPPKTPVIFS
jgi:hypothetical protein